MKVQLSVTMVQLSATTESSIAPKANAYSNYARKQKTQKSQ